MTTNERCAACGESVEPGTGMVVDDRVVVHDQRCLERWMLEGGGIEVSGTVLMYAEGTIGPLTPPDDGRS